MARRFARLCVAVVWVASAASVQGNEQPLWNAAWITDTQTPDGEWIATLIARVQADKPKLVLHTGDTRFEWANQCAWRSVMTLLRRETPPLEFHLAPGNHDLTNGVLKAHLRRAASLGVYRLDTGEKAEGQGYYHNRVAVEAAGPLWPAWNPDVIDHPAWQPAANKEPRHWQHPEIPYRYVFRRGGIRFIVCDCFYTDEQRHWLRDLIVRPDDSSLSIVLHHKHEVDDLAKYFEGLEGRHNVRLVLSGDHHNYCYEERHGVTFIAGAGMARGSTGENDAMTLWVFKDRLRLDRYVLPKGAPMKSIEGPTTIWLCKGDFSEYTRPATPAGLPEAARSRDDVTSAVARARPDGKRATSTIGPNLLYNGDFDNHVWYERYRGWSPTGWCQWFTRGGHAPEHAVGRYPSPPHPAHTGKEYVRIHMWAHAWRGGILQTVREVEPCHYYRLTAYGFFQPADAPEPNIRVGVNPRGTLASQFSADVTKHPAPKYDEGVGDDPGTTAVEGLDIDIGTVWSKYYDYDRWGKLQVEAEACSSTILAILYCAPRQRPAGKPIYEMNWDSASLHEIPWPTRRLMNEAAVVVPDKRVGDLIVTVQPELRTAQVTWATRIPAGVSQVLYRFLDSTAQNRKQAAEEDTPTSIPMEEFPFESPVIYERSARRHWVTLNNLMIPEAAVELQVIALSRVCEKGGCRTVSSPPASFRLK